MFLVCFVVPSRKIPARAQACPGSTGGFPARVPCLLRILAFLPLVCAAPALALETPPESRAAQRLRELRAESAAHPADPTPHFFTAYYLARAGDDAGTLAELTTVANLGDGFLPDATQLFPSLTGRPEFERLLLRFTSALPHTPDAPLAFTVPDVRFIPEGIAHDPVSGDFFMGSGPQRRIVRIKPDGAVAELSRASDHLLPVLGLAVDATARRLYAVTSNAFGYAGSDAPANRLVAYDLVRGAKLAEWAFPEAKGLNDVSIGADGRLFVSDAERASVWRLDPATGAITALTPPDSFPGLNGLAVAGDAQHLYVAHALGLSRVTLADGTSTRLTLPPRQTAAAIDGLYFWRGHLLGIQNVTTPGRVIALRLAADGVTVTQVETLQSHHHPLFETPTTGAVAADGFYVLARTQLGLYDPEKGYTAPGKLRPPAVIRVPLPERQ